MSLHFLPHNFYTISASLLCTATWYQWACMQYNSPTRFMQKSETPQGHMSHSLTIPAALSSNFITEIHHSFTYIKLYNYVWYNLHIPHIIGSFVRYSRVKIFQTPHLFSHARVESMASWVCLSMQNTATSAQCKQGRRVISFLSLICLFTASAVFALWHMALPV